MVHIQNLMERILLLYRTRDKMNLKTFAVSHPKVEYGPNIIRRLYLDGTKRIELVYFLFNKTIDNETRRGFQVVEQTARITAEDLDNTFFHNSWENSRYVINSLGLEKRVAKK